MWLAFLILLVYSFPTFSEECGSNPICKSGPTSNYTVILDVSSRVLAQGEVFNYALAGEEVTLIATAYNNSSNFTDSNNQSQVYYYNFQCRNASARSNIWYHINCSEESTAVEIWNTGGRFECSVQLLTQDNKPLACNSTQIVIAVEKDGLCDVAQVKIVQEYHNMNKSAFAVGNVTFVADIDTESFEYLFFFLYYSFGDNTSATLQVLSETPYISHTHNYTDVCNNCSYDIIVIMVRELPPKSPQYCAGCGMPINVIKPVTLNNSDIMTTGKLYKGHPVKLKMTSDATPPFNVCWHLYDPTVKHDINTSNCPLLNSTGTECQTLNRTDLFNPTINFASTGSYMLLMSFENDANCTVKSHTLLVGDAVPVTAEVVGGIVGIVVACVIVFILIVSVLGYIQYRRYKNQHIETAKFNFVVLPPINTNSRWAQFKMACYKRWYKFRGRRFRKGLVPMLDGSGRYTYSDSYSTTVSYGALLQSEHESYKDLQVSVLRDYVSSGVHGNNNDDR